MRPALARAGPELPNPNPTIHPGGALRQVYYGNTDPEMASRYSFLQGLQQYRARCTSFNPAVNALFKQARALLRAPPWGTQFVQLLFFTLLCLQALPAAK